MALGFDAISDVAISGETGAAGPVTARPSFVSNASAPQIDTWLAAGCAALFTVGALASSNTAQGAEYQFGTHAAAIYESQFKGAIWGPAAGGAPPPKSLGAFVKAPEQAYTNAPSWVLASVLGATPQPIALIVGGPQSVDLTLQGDLVEPLVSPQGRPLTQFSVAPQADTTQPPALVFAAALVPVVAPPVPARLALAAPQTVDLTLAASIFSPQAGIQGRTPPTIVASPQAIDLTVQGWIETPQLTQQGRVPTLTIGGPQSDPSQIAAQFFGVQPAAVVASYAVRSVSAAPQSADLTVQASIFKPQPAGQGPTPALIVAAPKDDQTQPQALLSMSRAGQTPPHIATLQGAPQADTTQIPAQVFPSLRTPPIVPNPIAGFVTTLPQFEERVTQTVYPSLRAGFTVRVPAFTQGAPQFVDLTLQGWTLAPLTRQGPVPPIALGAPQSDPTQVAPLVIPSARTPAIAPNPIAGFLQTAPQFEERTTAVVYPSLRSGQTSPRIAQITGAPQADPSLALAQVFSPGLAPLAPVGPVTRVPVTLPQFEDRPTAIVWPSVRAGQKPPRITSLWAAPQNVDLTIQGFAFGPSALKSTIPLGGQLIVLDGSDRLARVTGHDNLISLQPNDRLVMVINMGDRQIRMVAADRKFILKGT